MSKDIYIFLIRELADKQNSQLTGKVVYVSNGEY